MQNIQQIIVDNFTNNIEYIKEKHPTLFDKLSAFDSAVEHGHYNETYELRYECNQFDVYNKTTKTMLYQNKSDQHTALVTQSVNFSKKENVFESFKLLDKEYAPEGFQYFLNVSHTYKQNDKQLKQIFKFIFFGTKLGLHIEAIAKKIAAKHYLVVEDNLELFRLSLFTTQYYQIAKNSTITFAIFEDKDEFNKTTDKFLYDSLYYNHYIKFVQLQEYSEEKLKLLHLKITTQSHLNFFYSSILDQYPKALEYIHKNYNFLNLLTTKINTLPVLLLAPGPSLNKNIEFVQNKKDRVIIVALSATLSILYKHDIRPDIITHFDGFERSIVHFERCNDLNFFKDALLLLAAKTPKEIVNMFPKKNIFMFETGTNYKKNIGSISTFCAGSSTYLLLLALGVKELYLLGLDLALDQKTLQTHSDNYAYNTTLKIHNKDNLSFRDSLVLTSGNFTESVKTTPNFLLSIKAINEISTFFKKENQYVYNLNDGAKLNNTISIQINHIDFETKKILDKQALHEQLLLQFSDNSSNHLTIDEKKNINNLIINTQKFQEILKKQKNIFIHNPLQFLESLKEFDYQIISHLSEENEVLLLIYQAYSRFVYTYIFDFFNSKNINFSQKTATINENICKTLIQIANKYLKTLQGI